MSEMSKVFSRNTEEVDLSLIQQSRQIPRKSVRTPIISIVCIGRYPVSVPIDEAEDDWMSAEHYSWVVT